MAKVIFLQNIKGVALMGDVKDVADGYARNFLLPHRLVVLATKETLKQAKSLRVKRAAAVEQEKQSIQELTEKLKNFTLTVERAASEEGTLYDGLDAAEISSYLKEQSIRLEPEQVRLKENIKKIGTHQIELDLGHGITATLNVEVKKME